MKKLDIKNKTEIKQLLYTDRVLGVRDSKCRSFSGFELWWYDKQHDICNCCQTEWTTSRRHVERFTLDKAANVLWHKRRALFVRTKHLSEDTKLQVMSQALN